MSLSQFATPAPDPRSRLILFKLSLHCLCTFSKVLVCSMTVRRSSPSFYITRESFEGSVNGSDWLARQLHEGPLSSAVLLKPTRSFVSFGLFLTRERPTTEAPYL